MRWLLLALLLALLLGVAQARAVGLTNILTAPSSSVPGIPLTVVMDVQNTGPNPVDAIHASLSASATTFGAALISGPAPVSQSLAVNATGHFTWTFSGNAQCSSVNFTGSAAGYDNVAGVTVTSSQSSTAPVFAVCSFTPTPSITQTPSPTASPVVTATPTSTETPWLVTATPGPAVGDARIPGNLYHPDQGQPLQLRFDAPFDGTVTIDLYNRVGQRVRHIERSVTPGTYTELWDGRADNGILVASGIYVAQFKGKSLFKAVKFAVVR